MKIRADNGEFIVPKKQEHYILFEYPDGVFDIRMATGNIEMFIPRDVEQTSAGFRILNRTKKESKCKE